MIRIAINGFGRIGRNFLRILMLNPQIRQHIELVAVNIGPGKIDAVAHMFTYDTLMGTYPGIVAVEGNYLLIDDAKILLFAQSDPAVIDWGKLNIDWVVDCSGAFTHRERAQTHLDAGAKHVLISAPAHGEDVSIVPGVNEEKFNPSFAPNYQKLYDDNEEDVEKMKNSLKYFSNYISNVKKLKNENSDDF